MLGVEEHLVPRCEPHVPPVSVELRLAPVLPLLEQRPHLGRYASHEVGYSLAITHGDSWVGSLRWSERAARVLAAVGVERCVAGAQR